MRFWNFIWTDRPFEKVLQSFETCVLVNNNLYRKLVLSLELPTTFDERFILTWVPFFMADYNLLCCILDNFTFKVLYWVILY